MLLSKTSSLACSSARPAQVPCVRLTSSKRPLAAQPNAAGLPGFNINAPLATCGTSAMPQRERTLCTATGASKGAPGTVKIIIQGRKLEVTDAIRTYVQEKITRALGNVAQVIKEVDVTLSVRGGDTGTGGKKLQKVDVTVYTYRNGVIRVEDQEATLYASIDIVCDKLSRKMTKIKEKGIAKGKWPGRAADKSIAKEEQEQEYNEYLDEVIYETKVFDREEKLRMELAELNQTFPATVRRTKVLELDPVSADEAIEEMENVGHDFFVYRDLESDEIQVVYKRAEQGYGVIVPRKRD